MFDEPATIIAFKDETKTATGGPESIGLHDFGRDESDGPRTHHDLEAGETGLPQASTWNRRKALQQEKSRGIPKRGNCAQIEDKPLFWRPTGFYWRRGIRESGSDCLKLRMLALALVAELEEHKALIRDLGWIPPKIHVHPDEITEKGWHLNGQQDGGHSIRVEVGPDGRERSVIEESH